MTVKGVFLFLMLLLSWSTSFSFSDTDLKLDEQEISTSDSLIEEESADLYQGVVSFFKTNIFQGGPVINDKSFVLQSSFRCRTQEDYLKRSKNITLGLDVEAIIFPFHVFL